MLTRELSSYHPQPWHFSAKAGASYYWIEGLSLALQVHSNWLHCVWIILVMCTDSFCLIFIANRLLSWPSCSSPSGSWGWLSPSVEVLWTLRFSMVGAGQLHTIHSSLRIVVVILRRLRITCSPLRTSDPHVLEHCRVSNHLTTTRQH